MSPRRTEALHEVGHRQHLGTIVVVGLQGGHLGGELPLVVEPRCSLDQCGTDCLGAGHTGCLELVEGLERFVVESN